MHEVKIYGEIIPFEDNWIIEQGGFSNLTHLQNQLKEADGKDVRVRINSCGGDCDTGFAMYAELRRYAKDNNAKVETFGEARVASIATVIFLAGDTRILTEHTEPFVHNAWTYAMGDSKQIMRAAVDLEKYNSKIANHYAAHTDLTFDEALALMEAETSITTEEAKSMRFATDIEEVLRPVALQRFNPTKNDMNKNQKTPGVLALAKQLMTALMRGGAVNKIVFTSDPEVELDFYELGEDAVVKVGDKATIGGKPAGEVLTDAKTVTASGETYVFVGEVLDQILPVESDDVNEEAVALQATIDELTAQLETVTNKATELAATNKTQTAIIAKYTAAQSQGAPDDTKAAPNKSNAPKPNIAAEAISNFLNKKPINKN